MRDKLRQIGRQLRHRYTGSFERFGYKTYGDHYSPTILLLNVKDEEGNQITDHLWFNLTKGFLRLGKLQKGDRISFNARVALYEKHGYYSRERDYKLSFPTKIVLETEEIRERMPHEHYAVIGYIMKVNEKFYREEGRPVESFFTDKYLQWEKEQLEEES